MAYDNEDPELGFFMLGLGAIVFMLCIYLAIGLLFGLEWVITVILVSIVLGGLFNIYTHYTTPKIDR